MEKNLRYSALLSVYGALLTQKQLDTMEYYYDEDLSLGEIAENTGISRQGVRDFIKRAEEALDDYEAKMGLLEKLKLADKIEECAAKIKETALNAGIGRLAEEIIDMAHQLK